METEEILSVLDHEAFVAKHIPDTGYDIKELQVFHWKLQDWKKLEKKLTSPEFECGGHKWRILLFPSGNSSAPTNDAVSVFLNCVGPKRVKEDWHACAQFALVISNPHDPTTHTVSHAHHRFTAEEHDWGFTRFTEQRKLFQPQPGHNRPTIEEDSAVISAYVRVLEDPTGVLWHNFVNYDSKKQTGYVGLKNQGATGYMNTVLQSLFCTNYLRKAVYQIPTEDQNPTESTSLALQRVFYNLQTSNQPVETTELTNSFGWKSIDAFLQHDVEEFNRVLQDKLESLMKGTRAEGAIQKLFAGKTKSFIKCVNVDYESSRTEQFLDLNLNVGGIKTLHDSFRDYVSIQMLDGEFKYPTEGFGPQDARKGIIFRSFPPVLHLYLKRYHYDMQRGAMVKIHDRFEFPFEIDLAEFLDETADRTKPWKYKLHGVLVHSGDLHGGQYFAFVKPDQHSRWFKFDDERVTPVMDREVLEEGYGGEPLSTVVPQTQRNQARVTNKSTNARMLVYIRETAIDEILAPLTEEDTPLHLKRRLDEECAQMVAKAKAREEERSFMTAKVITDETFSRHQGFDLAVFEGNLPPSDLATFRVLKQEMYSAFKSRVAEHFGYPESRIRLWVVVNRQNKTIRPDVQISEDEPLLTLEVIRSRAVRHNELRVYLDILPEPSKRIQSDNGGTFLIFLKHFDTADQSLFGTGKVHIPGATKVSDLVPIINERMGWASGTALKFYEEIKPGMIEPMKPEHTLVQSGLQDGDIVCFQVDISDQEARKLESQGLRSNPQQFYNFLQNRAMEKRPV